MTNVKTLTSTYIVFSNVQEFLNIIDVFKKFGFSYKNGTLDEATELVETTVVDKVICHDNFVMTSKEKVTTISYKAFMKLAHTLTNSGILNNDNNNNMVTTTPRAIINQLKSDRLYKDEKYIEGLASKAEVVEKVLNNFVATLDKSEDKANKISELLNAYCTAIADRDISEIDRLEKLIDSSMKFVTETNKVLSAINKTGNEIITKNKKDDKDDGEKFIGE